MQQIFSVWTALDPRRRIIVMGATIVMFAAVIGLSRIAAQPSYTLLYSGLEASAAGEVVAALEQRSIEHEIRGGAIYVPSTERDQLRMVLASEGLPANSTSGYELLDSLSGFGTTAQMFDAAYWRAKEGELARTIVASQQISAARVHIANPSSSPFTRGTAATASVTVTAMSGSISAQQAQGFKYLVASAVSGLSPDDVSVIDGRRGIVVSGDESLSGMPESSDKAETLRQNVLRLLEARVGKGKAVVEVSVEPVTDLESIVERRFDPETRVAISTQTEERSNSSTDTRNGAVTVASNLPDGGGASGGDASSNNTETRESINYEVSETTRELQRMPGAVKRLTVAVLIDGITTVDPTTGEAVWSVRSDDELTALEALVGSAIGLDEARGDSLTIRSMEFEPVLIEGTAASPSPFSVANLDIMRLLQLAVLTVVTLVLGLFVVRPILAKPVSAPALPSPVAETSPLGESSLPALESASYDPPALSNDMDNGGFELPNLGVVSDFDLGEEFGMPTDPVKRLKKLIEDREEETVEILRSWIEDAEGTA